MTEKKLTGLEVAKMILIYEMMLQALADKGNELAIFMVPCADPRERTKEILSSLDHNIQLSEEDKSYYRELVETVDRLWLYWHGRHINIDGSGIPFSVNPTLGNPNA